MLLLDNVNVDDMEMENEKRRKRGKESAVRFHHETYHLLCALRIILPHNPDDRRIQ